MKLVSSFDWINFNNLADAEKVIADIFNDERAKDFIDESRKSAICTTVVKRIQTLKDIAEHHCPLSLEIMTEDDVEENVAEEYTKN